MGHSIGGGCGGAYAPNFNYRAWRVLMSGGWIWNEYPMPLILLPGERIDNGLSFVLGLDFLSASNEPLGEWTAEEMIYAYNLRLWFEEWNESLPERGALFRLDDKTISRVIRNIIRSTRLLSGPDYGYLGEYIVNQRMPIKPGFLVDATAATSLDFSEVTINVLEGGMDAFASGSLKAFEALAHEAYHWANQTDYEYAATCFGLRACYWTFGSLPEEKTFYTNLATLYNMAGNSGFFTTAGLNNYQGWKMIFGTYLNSLYGQRGQQFTPWTPPKRWGLPEMEGWEW